MHLLHLTPQQLKILAEIQRIEADKKLEITFQSPASDAENMRRSIYLDGGLAMLNYLFEFDAILTAEKELEKRDLLSPPPATSVLPTPEF